MKLILAILCLALTQCTVCIKNRVFPSLEWYWSDAAKIERSYDKP